MTDRGPNVNEAGWVSSSMGRWHRLHSCAGGAPVESTWFLARKAGVAPCRQCAISKVTEISFQLKLHSSAGDNGLADDDPRKDCALVWLYDSVGPLGMILAPDPVIEELRRRLDATWTENEHD